MLNNNRSTRDAQSAKSVDKSSTFVRERPPTSRNDDATHSYIDTGELFIRSLPEGTAKALRKTVPDRRDMRIEKLVRNGYVRGFKLTAQRPSVAAVGLFDTLQYTHNAASSRFDIAYEFTLHDLDFFVRHLTMPHRRKYQIRREENGFYLILYRNRRPAWNIAVYKGTSKITGQPCIRVEIRLLNAKGCERLKIERIRELINLDPSALFDRCIRLRAYHPDMLDGMKRSFVKAAIRAYRKREREGTFSQHGKLYGRNLKKRIERVIERMLVNDDVRYAQRVKDTFPRQFERVPTLSSEVLRLPRILTFRGFDSIGEIDTIGDLSCEYRM